MWFGFGIHPVGQSIPRSEGVAPTQNTPPNITGMPTVGQTLTVIEGLWSGTSPMNFAYQWQRNGQNIQGATSTSYLISQSDLGMNLRVVVTATNPAGSVSATSLPTGPVTSAITALPVSPTARWHPEFSAVTVTGARVSSATDLQGLANLSEGAVGKGPLARTDALGRKFWRFDVDEFLNVASSLTIDNRNVSVFFVGRVNRTGSSTPIFSGGNAAQGSALSGGNMLDVAVASNSAPFLRCASRAGSLDTTNARWMVPGAQLQVLATTSRTTANGAISLFINDRKASVAQSSISRPVLTGGEIGRNPLSVTTFGWFDLYELIVYAGAVSDVVAAQINAALMMTYGIVPVQNQLVLEGDSITQGTGLVTAGLSCAALLGEPGTNRLPANWRVVNRGTSGNTVTELVTKRDAVDSWSAMTLPGGQNVLALEIGRNDFGSGGRTAAQHYANVVSYLNTPTTGILQRGWTVRAMANIASSSTLQIQIDAYRALIRNPQFLTDTLTSAGQAYAGKMTIVPTDLITDGGQTIFQTSADAGDATYYAGDSTHPSILGALLRVTGGDDPGKAIAAGLSA